MRVKYLFFLIFLCSIYLITGCSSNGINETEKEESEFPPTMTGLISINGNEYEMGAGGYRWERQKGSGSEVTQTDSKSPNQMAEHIKPVSVQANQKVDINIEKNPNIKVYLWNEKGREEEIELDGNRITVPAQKGTYIYEVVANWKNGIVSYTFVIEV